MSESYGEGYTGAEDVGAVGSSGASGTAETAKHEAAEVADTAKSEASHVVDTAKGEAATVANEAKRQVKDLYAQSTGELKDQAATQQQRVAEGLRSVGDELGSLADGAENPGLAADLVQQASTRVGAIASWIGDRDPGSLLDEVKSYARRQPGTFIAVAAIAGLAVGRLTRALAENAKDQSQGSSAGNADGFASAPRTTGAAPVDAYAAGTGYALDDVSAGFAAPDPAAGRTADDGWTTAVGTSYGEGVVPSTDDATPLYDRSRATHDADDTGAGSGDVRPDSV